MSLDAFLVVLIVLWCMMGLSAEMDEMFIRRPNETRVLWEDVNYLGSNLQWWLKLLLLIPALWIVYKMSDPWPPHLLFVWCSIASVITLWMHFGVYRRETALDPITPSGRSALSGGAIANIVFTIIVITTIGMFYCCPTKLPASVVILLGAIFAEYTLCANNDMRRSYKEILIRAWNFVWSTKPKNLSRRIHERRSFAFLGILLIWAASLLKAALLL